jgi:hypothetical protein
MPETGAPNPPVGSAPPAQSRTQRVPPQPAPRASALQPETAVIERYFRNSLPTRADGPKASDWWRQAECAQNLDRDWFTDRADETLRCRLICYRCPVRNPCLHEAITERDPWGVWGGLTVEERSLRALVLGDPLPAVLPAHGTNQRYAKHACRCPRCRKAHTLYVRQQRAHHKELGVDRSTGSTA